MLLLLQRGDQRIGLGHGELPAGLSLGEMQRATGVAEVGVPGRLHELEQLADLPRRRRRSRWLPERHPRVSPVAARVERDPVGPSISVDLYSAVWSSSPSSPTRTGGSCSPSW